MATFDPYDWESFFFGALEREEANKLLEHSIIGAFLLRESRSRPTGYSLSVRECSNGDHQIYHYFIEKKNLNDSQVFEMCGNSFIDIPSLITYYQMHVLEKSTLVQPVLRQALCKVIGRYKFDGERVSDLPFERGEVLEIIGKPEELWWTARNSLNSIGLIPVPYIKLYEDGDEISLLNPSTNSSSGGSVKRCSTISVISESSVAPGQRDGYDVNQSKSNSSKQSLPDAHSDNRLMDVGKNSVKCSLSISKDLNTPAWARVIADRFPSIYDTDALPLKQGQLVYVLEVFSTGMCRGQTDVNGRIGVFPISYVEWTNISSESGPWVPLEDNYDCKGRLLHPATSNNPIFECCINCDCVSAVKKKSCQNRVVQFGIQCNLEVYDTCCEFKGRGVRSPELIVANQFVVEYVGEVITQEEAKSRFVFQQKTDCHNYIFTLNEFFSGKFHKTFIDAREMGNLARFINHSCAPNLFPQIVRVGSVTPRLALFALRDIPPGEELSYDYGMRYEKEGGEIVLNNLTDGHPLEIGAETSNLVPEDKVLIQQSDVKLANVSSANHSLLKATSKICLCGAQNCCGVLPSFIDDLF